MARKCLTCKTDISQAHFNRKRCAPCAKKLLKKPKHNLTKEQGLMVKKLAGSMVKEEIAKKIGASRSSVMRYASQNGFSLDTLKYKENVINEVCSYYEKYGRTKTQEMFPNVIVRSIVERYKNFKPRQTRWKKSELIELVKMAGLISPTGQAKFFNRPNANEGSIKSVWIKKFNNSQSNINGMPHYRAKILCDSSIRYIRPKGISRDKALCDFRRIALWVDMENSLKKGTPEFLKEAITTMADFQRWLHGKNAKENILNMINEREITANDRC